MRKITKILKLTKNLKNLLEKDKVNRLLLKHRQALGLSSFAKVQEITRSESLAPETYTLLFSVNDKGKVKYFRGNASSENDRSVSYYVFKNLKDDFSSGKFLIPQNFFYDEEYNLSLYENINGQILTKHLNDNLESLEKGIRLSAQWLTKFHSMNLTNIELPSYHFTFVEDYLSRTYPDLALSLDATVELLLSKLGSRKKRLIHGDFQTNNIIVNDTTVWVFDFNDAAYDSPMLDLASFLVQLKTMLLRFADVNNFSRLEKVFLDSYESKIKISEQEKNDLTIYKRLYLIKILSSLSATLSDNDPNKKIILKSIYNSYVSET